MKQIPCLVRFTLFNHNIIAVLKAYLSQFEFVGLISKPHDKLIAFRSLILLLKYDSSKPLLSFFFFSNNFLARYALFHLQFILSLLLLVYHSLFI